MKLIDKDALAANIEARYNECLQRAKIIDAEYWNGKADAYRDMLVAFDTLEVQEEPVSKFLNTESMIESYKQRLISQANGMKNSPLIDMCLVSYKHGINETLDTLNLSNVLRTTKNWKEPASEDLKTELNKYIKDNFTIGREVLEKDYLYLLDRGDILAMVRHFTNLQKQRMMKKAVEATVTDIRTYKEENEVDFTIMLEKGIIPYELEQEVKLIIVNKED
jgi:hypothetical protein